MIVKILLELAILDIRAAIGDQKIEFFKITACTFCIIIKSSADIKTSLTSAISLHIFLILVEN